MRLFNRTRSQPRADLSRQRRVSPAQVLALVLIVVSMSVLVCAITAPLWLPRTARQFIPDRYIVAYAPEPMLELIYGCGIPVSSADLCSLSAVQRPAERTRAGYHCHANGTAYDLQW
jgi:hypothetical protein